MSSPLHPRSGHAPVPCARPHEGPARFAETAVQAGPFAVVLYREHDRDADTFEQFIVWRAGPNGYPYRNSFPDALTLAFIEQIRTDTLRIAALVEVNERLQAGADSDPRPERRS